MAKVHGKGTALKLGDADLSVYSNNVTWTETSDTHDTTTYGRNAKNYAYGLEDGTATIEGLYDNTEATGPAAVIRAAKKAGLPVPFAYMPEGATTGRPVRTVDVLITQYEETAPVADMVTFSVELQFSDEVVDTTAPVVP